MKKLQTQFEVYLLSEKHVSANTFAAYKNDLDQFCRYLEKKNISESQIDEQAVKAFVYELASQELSARSMARKISSLKIFFSFLHDRLGVPNYAQELIFPKLDKRLPEALSEEEVESLFDAADQDATDVGLRNKIMLSLLYVSGMRISELVNLRVTDLHFDTGFISVTGKGGKGRMIPLPRPMLESLHYYLQTAHRSFVSGYQGARETDLLFPIYYGGKMKPITRQAFWIILKDICARSGIARPLSPHTLRHSFATHMLKRGADLRSLQLLLGHETIATVQIYTHVETSYLRDMYDKKHPRS